MASRSSSFSPISRPNRRDSAGGQNGCTSGERRFLYVAVSLPRGFQWNCIRSATS